MEVRTAWLVCLLGLYCTVYVSLAGAGTGFNVGAVTIPDSGATIVGDEGDENVQIFCELTLNGNKQATSWSIMMEGQTGQTSINIGDPGFNITGEPIPGAPFFSFNTNLTILKLTADLNNAVIYCGVVGNFLAANFTISIADDNRFPPRLVTNPRSGVQLGGTAVFVSGPRFDIEDQITCIFQGIIQSEATYVNSTHILCISPPFVITGRLRLQLRVNEEILEQEGVIILLSFEDAFEVDFFNEALDLLLEVGSQVALNWPPSSVLPFLDPDIYTVDIGLYGINAATLQLLLLGELASDIDNSGQATVTIPRRPFTIPLLAVAFQVSFRRFTDTSAAIEGEFPFSLVNVSSRIGVWSDVGLLPLESLNLDFLDLCNFWIASQPPGIGEELLRRVQGIPCPPTEAQAWLPNSGLLADEQQSLHQGFYHPGTRICYNSITSGEEGTGQQCCYDSNSNLVIGSPGGGSLNRIPQSVDPVGHFIEDTSPFIYCCKGRFPKCSSYFERRPSDDGSRFNPALPACAYGDPHLITLDGHKYTFNGRGEFWLVQTLNNQLTVQGRMVEATNSAGSAASATVFSAIVGKQGDSDTVQFEVRDGVLIAAVDGETVRFDDLPEQEFNNVLLSDIGNGILVARFSGGTYLGAMAENGFISTIFLSLPSDLRNITRGLMGVFNGDPSDDLLPRNGSQPLALNSSLQTIHNSFGITWIIDRETDSLFSYSVGSSWATFFDPGFVPTFETEFSDPALEAEADAICGDDPFCKFDIAATGRTEIGLATFLGGREFDEIAMFSVPTVCDPPCINGVCLHNNTCNCVAGFSVEDRCTEPVFIECTQNPCVNGGTCTGQLGLDFRCECAPGFTGEFCRDISLPAELRFINDSPRVEGNNISADIQTSRPVASMLCSLTGLPRQDCSTGSITFTNVPPRERNRPYILRVVARTSDRLRTVIRRAVAIEQLNACTVHLINDGVSVTASTVTIEFAGTGPVITFLCSVDRGESSLCESPLSINGLAPGEHRVRFIPQDCGPNFRANTVRFEV